MSEKRVLVHQGKELLTPEEFRQLFPGPATLVNAPEDEEVRSVGDDEDLNDISGE